MFKVSDLAGFLVGLIVVAALFGVVLWRVTPGRPSPPATRAPAQARAPAASTGPEAGCSDPAWDAAARQNRATLYTLAWSPFGPPERGWATYAPLISQATGARCGADTAGFAASLAAWQAKQGLAADGVLKPADFDRLRDQLALQRPFVQATRNGGCPAAPDPATLAPARPDEAFGGKTVLLRPGALAAYRRMVEAARLAGIGTRPPLLRLVSGYRGQAEESARCGDGGCNTLSRARCSAHRTGLALDLYLEPVKGEDPTSTADENRRNMAASVEYRWLVANAARYGFLPYAYEPWHWEWTGEAP